MANKKISNNLFLTSFLPAIAYWYLDEHFTIKIALIGGILLGITEIIFEKWYSGHVHALSKFNLILILFLGGISLMGNDGLWFKLQPALSFFGVSFFLIYRLKKGKGVFAEMLEGFPAEKRAPDFIMQAMERHMTYFFLFYGTLMGILAIWFSTSIWVFFKTIGLYIMLGVFMIIQLILNRKRMQEYHSKLIKAQIIRSSGMSDSLEGKEN